MLIPGNGNGEDKLRAIEFYSGIGTLSYIAHPGRSIEILDRTGGLHLALATSLVKGRVVRAFDWDQTACKVYEANYGPHVVQKVCATSFSFIRPNL